MAFNLLYVAYCIKTDAEVKVDIVKAVVHMIVFNYTYLPLFVLGFITQRNKTWKRTEHTRSIVFDANGVVGANNTTTTLGG